jgi:translation initiation factor 2B subunit (eIF-2B alpha/beta/delta family)
MTHDWLGLISRIRRDHRSGASALLGMAVEAGRLFLQATQGQPHPRLPAALRRFTLGLTQSQPSMAPFLTLANALWLGLERYRSPDRSWDGLHDALVEFADGIDTGLQGTVRRAARLVRPRSLVLTYSNSLAVRMALQQALAAGRRFEVVCSESRPMHEGLTLARDLARSGIPVHLVVDAALVDWVGRADLVLLGADAILPGSVVNKVGTYALLESASRAGVPAYVLADTSKWLPDRLFPFWRTREETPREITTARDPNLHVHNYYFEPAPLRLVTGLIWNRGIAAPDQVTKRIAHLKVSLDLVRYLRGQAPPTGKR